MNNPNHSREQMVLARARLNANRGKAHLTAARPPANRNRKAAARLDSRRNDYALMMATDNKLSSHSRKETGGFRKPGSNN